MGVRGADFFFTGFVVVWPLMAWSGNLEAGIAVCALLLLATFCCAMLADDPREDGDGG